MQNEIWKDIPGYDGKYQVSNLGNVRSFKQSKLGKLLKPYENHHGYLKICLHTKNKKQYRFVHRLVAENFLTIPESDCNYEINHKDTDKKNNCVENLEWTTHKENMEHAFSLGIFGSVGYGGKNQNAKKACQYDKDGNLIKVWDCISDASRFFNIGHATISNVIHGRKKTARGYVWRLE